MNQKDLENIITFFLYTSIILLVCFEIILNVTPPISRDALIHHLAVPKLWLSHGGCYEIPWAEYSYYPMYIDLLYLICLYFKNDIAPKFIHLGFGFGTGWLIYLYLSEKFNRNWGLLGTVIFITTPIVVWLSTSAYVDLGMTFFITGSVLAFIRWRDSEYSRFKWLLISSFCMGIAVGSKYNALIAWFIVNLMLMFSYVRDTNKQIFALKFGMLFFVITILVASPWYLKNYIQTGNPFYPLFGSFFKSLHHHLGIETTSHHAIEKARQVGFFKMREVMYGEKFWETLLIPIRMFFQGKDNSYQYFQGSLNPILIVFSPFIFLNKRYGKDKFIFVFFSIIFISMAYFLTAKQVRYILPVLPFLTIIAVMGIKDLLDRIGERMVVPVLRSTKKFKTTAKGLVIAGIVILLFFNFSYVKYRVKTINPFSYITGNESRDEFLNHHLLHYSAVKFINKTLPDDAVVFTMFLGRRGYYLNRNYKNEPLFGMNTIRQMIKSSINEKAFDTYIRSMKVTHMFIRSDLFYRYLRDNFSETKIKRLLNIMNRRWTKLFDQNGYTVWNVHEKTL